jgi:ribosome biogenesis GTPase
MSKKQVSSNSNNKKSEKQADKTGEHSEQGSLKGLVLFGINNIYTVRSEGQLYESRIKGKVLKGEEIVYNPIAVGDWVEITPDPLTNNRAWITDLHARTSYILRYNKKRNAPQIIAANIDRLICVTSAQKPPFRPRFLDRLLVTSHIGHATPLIFVNKSDLPLEEADNLRLKYYEKIGYEVIYGSTTTRQGLDELCKSLAGKTSAFVGQSGVGKSSLLNALKPGLGLKVGEVSDKFNRGAHVTTFAVMQDLDEKTRIIDTPGIRELEVCGIIPEELSPYFPEFTEAAKHCSFSTCQHLDEPDCRVKAEVEAGRIHPDRYESYARLHQALEETTKESNSKGL